MEHRHGLKRADLGEFAYRLDAKGRHKIHGLVLEPLEFQERGLLGGPRCSGSSGWSVMMGLDSWESFILLAMAQVVPENGFGRHAGVLHKIFEELHGISTG
jgi:hypothetical protein